MDIFWIQNPDPHNNRCGSATLPASEVSKCNIPGHVEAGKDPAAAGALLIGDRLTLRLHLVAVHVTALLYTAENRLEKLVCRFELNDFRFSTVFWPNPTNKIFVKIRNREKNPLFCKSED